MKRHRGPNAGTAGRAVATAWLAGALAVVPATGVAGEKGEYSLEAGGAVRMTGAYMHFPELELSSQLPDDALAGTVIRLLLDGDAGQHVEYEFNGFAELARAPAFGLGGSFSSAGAVRSPYRTRYLGWDYWDEGSIMGTAGADRVNMRVVAEPFEIQVGRFPINYSVTQVFTPNDFFAPFSATAINKMYKPGVDAVHVAVAPSALSSIGVDAVMGYDDDDVPDLSRSALLLRTAFVVVGFEWSAMGGRLAERWIVGGSTQGAIGPVGLRAEGHTGFTDRDGDFEIEPQDGEGGSSPKIHGRVAGGLDLPLGWRNTVLGAEYAYFSDGTKFVDQYILRPATMFPDDLPYGGRHYTGASAGLEIMPLVRVGTMGLVNVWDGSGLVSASLIWSVADEAEFLGGVFVPWGKRPLGDSGPPDFVPILRSEYGLAPLTIFFETRAYF